MGEPASYHGSCHCGAVDFDVTLDLTNVITCDCSRCQRLGVVLAFAPESAFHLHKGEDMLTSYHFASGKIDHLFCRVCGIQSFSRAKGPDGTPMVAVNVNCLDGVDPRALSAHHHNGAAA